MADIYFYHTQNFAGSHCKAATKLTCVR